MVTHSSILAWRTPWTEEPGGLQSKRSKRIGHNREARRAPFWMFPAVTKHQGVQIKQAFEFRDFFASTKAVLRQPSYPKSSAVLVASAEQPR